MCFDLLLVPVSCVALEYVQQHSELATSEEMLETCTKFNHLVFFFIRFSEACIVGVYADDRGKPLALVRILIS